MPPTSIVTDFHYRNSDVGKLFITEGFWFCRIRGPCGHFLGNNGFWLQIGRKTNMMGIRFWQRRAGQREHCNKKRQNLTELDTGIQEHRQVDEVEVFGSFGGDLPAAHRGRRIGRQIAAGDRADNIPIRCFITSWL